MKNQNLNLLISDFLILIGKRSHKRGLFSEITPSLNTLSFLCMEADSISSRKRVLKRL